MLFALLTFLLHLLLLLMIVVLLLYNSFWLSIIIFSSWFFLLFLFWLRIAWPVLSLILSLLNLIISSADFFDIHALFSIIASSSVSIIFKKHLIVLFFIIHCWIKLKICYFLLIFYFYWPNRSFSDFSEDTISSNKRNNRN